jgi:hypothetical protein
MNGCRTPFVVRSTVRIAKLLVRLYPPCTRRRFGDDLVEVATEVVERAHACGGDRAVAALWPRLLADFAAALVSEYRDLWCASVFDPQRFALACLAVTAAVWLLIIGASTLDVRWVAAMLTANPPLTVVLAVILPAVALASSCLCLATRTLPAPFFFTPFRVSAAATIGTWTTLALHIASHG